MQEQKCTVHNKVGVAVGVGQAEGGREAKARLESAATGTNAPCAKALVLLAVS